MSEKKILNNDTLEVTGNITAAGTSSSFNTGNSGTFVTNDDNNYPRITLTSSSAQLGLFRADNGGMYIGGSSDGFRIYTTGFAQKFLLDQSGNATFAGTIGATNFSGSSSGTNTGDQTLPTLSSLGGASNVFLANSGGAKLEIQNATDGGSGNGIYMWTNTDTNWGIYMAQAGDEKSLADTTASSGIDGATGHAIRFRVNDNSDQAGFIWENSANETLMQLNGGSEKLYTRNAIYPSNQTTNYVDSTRIANWQTAYGWGDHGLSAQDKTDIGNLSGTNTGDQDLSSYLTAETFSATDVVFTVDGNDVIAGDDLILAGGLSWTDSTKTLTSANDNTTYTAGNGLDLNTTTFSRPTKETARKIFTGINAASGQAKSYVIGRVYYCPKHWDDTWQNLEIRIVEEGYASGFADYTLLGYYNGTENQTLKLNLVDYAGIPSDTQRYRVRLGSHTDAGWNHSSQNVYYSDIIVDVAYYKQTKIVVDCNGHGYQNTNPTSGAGITVLYDSPASSNSTFSSDTKTSTFVGHDTQIYSTANLTPLTIGTTATTALAGNTSLLAIGTTATTAMAGNTLSAQNITDIGNLSGVNTGDQDLSGYLTSVPSEYLTQTEGDARYVSFEKEDRAVPSTGGWYRLAKIGRGGARFAISYTGGNMSPHTYVIDAFKNWNNEATIAVEKFGHANYITSFRISRREGTGNGDYYLEGEFTSLSNTHSFEARFQESLGYTSISEIYAVSSSSNLVASDSDDAEIIEELDTTAAEGLYLKNINLDGRLNLYTDSNTTSSTALVLNGTEVEKRTLGSLAFDSTTLGTASSTASTAYATSVQGTTADAALPKAGGTLTGGLTGTTATFSGLVFTKIYKTISVNIANSYVRVAEIDDTGGMISSTVRVTLTAHGSSHVTTCNAIISVGHSQDILIQSDNLDYTNVTLKVESNSNGRWTLSVKSSSANSTAYKIDIQGLSNNLSITPTPTTSQSGTTLEHTTNFGTNVTGVTANTPSSGGLKHQFGGKMFFTNVDSNTDSTTALVLDGNEVEKRTLGSNAFTSTAIPDGNSVIDWTVDNEDIVIHSGNYTDTDTWVANSATAAGYVASGASQNSKVWKTDANGIPAWREDRDTVYTHPTGDGNNHIPTGGSSGQFLKYSSSGTATWATPSYTTNTNTTYSAGGGLDLTSTTFSVEPDLRDGITHVGKDANNYIQFDSTNGRIDFYAGGVFVARMESDGDLHIKGDVIAFSDIFS